MATPSHIALANARRNASRVWRRRIDWHPARASLWSLLDAWVPRGARVALVGVGNGDDVPLRRLARRAGRLDLLDLDAAALAVARRKLFLARTTVTSEVVDVTAGASDRIIARACGDRSIEIARPDPAPDLLGSGDYDVIIGDLLYTQLLHPGLADSGLTREAVDRTMLRRGQPLTDAVVARLHASAPGGVVVHLHDLLGWWPGNQQRFAIDDVLALDTGRAMALVATGTLPYGCDPRLASERAGAELVETRFWRWNFGAGKQFLVCATVARRD